MSLVVPAPASAAPVHILDQALTFTDEAVIAMAATRLEMEAEMPGVGPLVRGYLNGLAARMRDEFLPAAERPALSAAA